MAGTQALTNPGTVVVYKGVSGVDDALVVLIEPRGVATDTIRGIHMNISSVFYGKEEYIDVSADDIFYVILFGDATTENELVGYVQIEKQA